MKKTLLALWLLAGCACSLQAKTIEKTLFISAGFFVGPDGGKAPALSFSPDSLYRQSVEPIIAEEGDSFVCRILNRDSISHQLLWDMDKSLIQAAPGATITLRRLLPSVGIFTLRKASSSLQGFPATHGLATAVYVQPKGTLIASYWQLASWDTTAMRMQRQGKAYHRFQLKPQYHTINGNAFSLTDKDSFARVSGRVGDTLLIFISNAGFAAHSVHFHGFHATVIAARAGMMQKGWHKDTFPLEEDEWVLLEIVPDKPGDYPVHDHNLLGTTGGGIYPNGMMVHMTITQ